MRTWIVRIIAVIVLYLLGSFALPYVQSKKGQVQRRQDLIIKLAAQRKWDAVTQMLTTDYEDQWSMSREDSVELAKELLQGFLVLNIDWTTAEITVNENVAKVRGHAKLSGSGVGFSQHIIDLVNTLNEPWVFTWRTDGWKPDDWKLLSLRNTELGGPLPVDAVRRGTTK